MSVTEALQIIRQLLERDASAEILSNRERDAILKLMELARGVLFGPHGLR